jgi:hypothetical protein
LEPFSIVLLLISSNALFSEEDFKKLLDGRKDKVSNKRLISRMDGCMIKK